MDPNSRWMKIKELGEGGQGKVYLVFDNLKISLPNEITKEFIDSVKPLLEVDRANIIRKDQFKTFVKKTCNLINMNNPAYQGALKILHDPKEARDADRAVIRIKYEIEAMSTIRHPNLLKILDSDTDSNWFVSQYHPKGTLDKNKEMFVGNFVKSLKAFRPLVEGVSLLHKKGIVHRDIKTQNVFLGSDDNLILGDFGLVFFEDNQHTRISDTFDNVGSRDWMPPWAMGMRIEEIRPSFDVYGLGKLLWSMVSGIPILQLWYYNDPRFDIEKLFPQDQLIRLLNPLLGKCLVQYEKDCIPNANALLNEVDQIVSIIDISADLIDQKSEPQCKMCGKGKYKLRINSRNNVDATKQFGLNPDDTRITIKIYICDYCGNVQLFDLDDSIYPKFWK